MNTQQAYEMMRIYLGRPGARRAYGSTTCMYEIQIQGKMHRCAIGCLLSPETLNQTRQVRHRHPRRPIMGVCALKDISGGLATVRGLGYELPELDGVNPLFLEEAQMAHDNLMNWAGNKFNMESLDQVARLYGLKVVGDEPGVVQRAPRKEMVTA